MAIEASKVNEDASKDDKKALKDKEKRTDQKHCRVKRGVKCVTEALNCSRFVV